ncbi:GNAT family N-acetyltransferase [Ferruginibacter paludis]|uniref:GNAT family N-acetyltransferase n=1 Tax=Ferruginibacter paludis TaxID=1310417 RepID=UPI0025B2DA2D|nr:GNAT family N-acetyltransferase [Ferruginibacter paludis]MDN3655877.1 GNAT family N-acetyltransferase [Ferruginibacter paludis]
MKQELIDIINDQNTVTNGRFIDKPVVPYVEKILNFAILVTYHTQGQLAGFIAYYCNDIVSKIAFLTLLCVKPEFAGKGIGQHLLNCSIEDVKSKGFTSFHLEVSKDNQLAIHLYERAGFEVISSMDKLFLMKKDLSHEG